jgi:hypothetical protein
MRRANALWPALKYQDKSAKGDKGDAYTRASGQLAGGWLWER